MRQQPGFWEERGAAALLLSPVAGLFLLLSTLRRQAYRTGVLKRRRLPVPVVVVGNITVGGSGKSPFVQWLAGYFKDRGMKPGIVARGYGGNSPTWPRDVTVDSNPVEVGDEPVMLAASTGFPVCVSPDRPAAAQRLVAQGCDLIISDDGLQHYALERDFEIVLIDGQRGLGNRWLLPSGPLRELPGRLREVGLVLQTQGVAGDWPVIEIVARRWVNVIEPGRTLAPAALAGKPLLAVAGIGNPGRFFSTLRELGLEFEQRSFADHHAYQPEDLSTRPGQTLIMTAKDAVKCRSIASADSWYLEVGVEAPPAALEALETFLRGLNRDG